MSKFSCSQSFIGLLAFLYVFCGANVSPLQAVPFAHEVVSYDPGTGFAVEFGTGLGYTLENAVLGAPNPATSFGPVTPFNPPFERSELISLGEGGHLVVRMSAPIYDDPTHLFGLDFIIYGSMGFVDVAFPDGQTDSTPSTFGQNEGQTRVSVSADNLTYYTLDESLAPVVDGYYPTDGDGTWGVPVDPTLTPGDFADRSAAEIKALYAGSAGGTGYDLAWAQTGSGDAPSWGSIEYIRIDVLSGRAEIDAIAAVPEPATWALLAAGTVLLLGWRWRSRRQSFRLRTRATTSPGYACVGQGGETDVVPVKTCR